MTLADMKKKAFAMIEELNPDSPVLTDDPDIEAKVNEVINQKMFELCRMKKLPQYIERAVKKGELITFDDLEKSCGYSIYQLSSVQGVRYNPKAGGKILKFIEDGIAEIELFVFPERITAKTKDSAYEFELPEDVLEIMPYGVAADLLASDVSAQYGSVYRKIYEDMLQRLDPRYSMPVFTVEGGVDI